MADNDITIRLPDWFKALETNCVISELEQRVDFVLDLCHKNIEMNTGGPFSAAVFDGDTGRLIAAGVNLVTSENLSCLHGEIVAMTLAQLKLNNRWLDGCELVSSCEPCSMCLGAISWAHISRLVYSATEEDAEAIGFDEGDKPEKWIDKLQLRGVEIIPGVRRQKGRELLQKYKKQTGEIY